MAMITLLMGCDVDGDESVPYDSPKITFTAYHMTSMNGYIYYFNGNPDNDHHLYADADLLTGLFEVYPKKGDTGTPVFSRELTVEKGVTYQFVTLSGQRKIELFDEENIDAIKPLQIIWSVDYNERKEYTGTINGDTINLFSDLYIKKGEDITGTYKITKNGQTAFEQEMTFSATSLFPSLIQKSELEFDALEVKNWGTDPNEYSTKINFYFMPKYKLEGIQRAKIELYACNQDTWDWYSEDQLTLIGSVTVDACKLSDYVECDISLYKTEGACYNPFAALLKIYDADQPGAEPVIPLTDYVSPYIEPRNYSDDQKMYMPKYKVQTICIIPASSYINPELIEWME
jgi:hypothetical protein